MSEYYKSHRAHHFGPNPDTQKVRKSLPAIYLTYDQAAVHPDTEGVFLTLQKHLFILSLILILSLIRDRPSISQEV